MALIFADRVKETTTTTGTGDITLSGAPVGFRAFSSALATSDTFYYGIEGGAEWEIGQGTFQSDGKVDRTEVYISSNSNNAVNFSAGTKNIFITVAAEYWNGMITDLADAMAPLPDNVVFEYEVTGSAVTTITTNGVVTLDINTDGAYEIVLELVSAASSYGNINMFVNNDATLSNYTMRYVYSSGTTLSTASDPASASVGTVSNTPGQVSFSVANLSLVNGKACFNSNWLLYNSAAAGLGYVYKSTTDTNITRLDFTCATASGIGVGSKVRILKKEY
jgi:hypothetical protein